MRYAQLRAFHAVATEGSVTQAAEVLGLTQPAISTQLRNLEAGYGVRLFDRTPTGLNLTEEGQKLLELVQDYVSQEGRIRDYLDGTGVTVGGRLRLVVDDPLTAITLIRFFQDSLPAVDITMNHGNTLMASQALQDDRVDVAVISDHGETELLGQRFIRLPMWRRSLQVLLPKGHALADRKSLSINDLADMELIERERGSLTRQAYSKLLNAAAIPYRARLTVTGRESLREAVAQGCGISFMFDYEHGFDERLTSVPLSEGQNLFQTSVVYLEEQKNRHVVRAFLQAARKARDAGVFAKMIQTADDDPN